jgi:hypothetical protein
MAASASKLAEQNVRVIVMRALYSGGSRNFTHNLRGTKAANAATDFGPRAHH